jgi:hypothetical protein
VPSDAAAGPAVTAAVCEPLALGAEKLSCEYAWKGDACGLPTLEVLPF